MIDEQEKPHKSIWFLSAALACVGAGQTTVFILIPSEVRSLGFSEFEVGLGTLDASSANITRGSGATIFSSSNSDNVVDFSAGTKDVFCTMPASKSVFLDATGTPVGAARNGFAVAMALAL